jgi:hypothetical protein
VLELSISIRVVGSFPGLHVRLESVPESLQQLSYLLGAQLEALLQQFGGDLPQAFRGPQQRRLRIAARHRSDQLFESHEDCRVFVFDSFASSSRSTHPLEVFEFDALFDLAYPGPYGRAGHLRGLAHDRDAAGSQRPRRPYTGARLA